MEKRVLDKLNDYYYISLLNSYIFSDDLEKYLNKRNIIFEEWFLNYMSRNLDINYEYEVYGPKERDNCYTMLNKLLLNSIENKNIDLVELCNSLVRTLNISHDENSSFYIESVYINSSLNPEKERKKVASGNYDLEIFRNFFYYSSMTAQFLLEEHPNDDLAIQLIANEFYFNSIVDILKEVPEILNNEDMVVKILGVLYENDRATVDGRPLLFDSPMQAINNQRVKRYVKKSYKKANKENC